MVPSVARRAKLRLAPMPDELPRTFHAVPRVVSPSRAPYRIRSLAGEDGGLVPPLVFKTNASLGNLGWEGSIPLLSRHALLCNARRENSRRIYLGVTPQTPTLKGVASARSDESGEIA